jgi:hypothetical protein
MFQHAKNGRAVADKGWQRDGNLIRFRLTASLTSPIDADLRVVGEA